MRRRPSHPLRKAASSPTRPSSPRIVKVFVSSTFRDFQKERDEPVKKTFPALRDHCARRHIVFINVDLRWGITEEQAEAGEILPICLAEMLDLYGLNDRIPEEYALSYSWLPERFPENVRLKAEALDAAEKALQYAPAGWPGIEIMQEYRKRLTD